MSKDKLDNLDLDDVSRSGVKMKVWEWVGYPAFNIVQDGRTFGYGTFVPTRSGVKKLRKFLKDILREMPKEGK